MCTFRSQARIVPSLAALISPCGRPLPVRAAIISSNRLRTATRRQEARTPVLYVGVDIVEIGRVAAVAERHPDRFPARIYTDGERAYCRGRAPQLAARFAAKEAVMKALGTGTRGVGWRDIEVVRKPRSAPEIVLHGRASARAEKLGAIRIALSLSHSREYAVASVVMESTGPSDIGSGGT